MVKLEILEPLKVMGFRQLWFSQLFSQAGMNLLTFALAIQVYIVTRSNVAVSFLTVAVVIPAIIFSTLAGVLVERWDKRKVLFFCNIARGVAIIGFILSSESVIWVYFLVAAISLISQFFVPAEAPLIPKLVSKDRLVTANSIFMMTIFLTMLLGGLFAGPLIDAFGIHRVFFALIAIFSLAAIFAYRIPSNYDKAEESERHTWSFSVLKKDALDGIAYIRETDKVGVAMFLLVLSQTIIATFSGMLPGLADQVLHLKVTDASILVLGPTIFGIVVGAVIVSQLGKKISLSRLINFGAFFGPVTMFLLGLTTGLLQVQILLFLLGLTNAFVDISANTILQRETDENIRSRIYGVLTSISSLIYIFPAIFAGAVADMFGVGRVFLVGGVLLFVIWLVKIRVSKFS